MLQGDLVVEQPRFETVVGVVAEPAALLPMHAYLSATSALLSKTLRSRVLVLRPASSARPVDSARRAADLRLLRALQAETFVEHKFEREHVACAAPAPSPLATSHHTEARVLAGRFWQAAGPAAIAACGDARSAVRVVLLTTRTDWMHAPDSAVPLALAACDMLCGKLQRHFHGAGLDATVDLEFAVAGGGADASAVAMPQPGQTVAVGPACADTGRASCAQPQPELALQSALLHSHRAARVPDPVAGGGTTSALAAGLARVAAAKCRTAGGLTAALDYAGIPAATFPAADLSVAELADCLAAARVRVTVLPGYPPALFAAAFEPHAELAQALRGHAQETVCVVPWGHPAELLQAVALLCAPPPPTAAAPDLLGGGGAAVHAARAAPGRSAEFAAQLCASLAIAATAEFAETLADGAASAVARAQLQNACLTAPGRPLHPAAPAAVLGAALRGGGAPL
jgi:hypothetical protein